jgi:ketosteroid isomerase-like protein
VSVILGIAMSQEHVEAFCRLVEAVNGGDADGVLQLTSEDAVLILIRSATEGAYHGHDGVRTFFADNAETFDVFNMEYRDVRDLGDRVLATLTVHARGKGSGVETDNTSVVIVTFRGGEMTRWENFADPQHAFEAAGLPPE